jgi:glycosyltransferase involved in cell wall biosynthesis
MNPQTVLVLPSWYPTARNPLLGPFVRDHVRAAAAYGHRMVVVVDDGVDHDLTRPFALAEEPDGDLRVFRLTYRVRTGLFGYVPAALSVARQLAREGTPVDILHAHIHRMGWAAVVLGTALRRPTVITENSSGWPRRLMTAGEVWRARIAFPRAALVCPVNKRLQEAIESYGVQGRFRVVPNTVDAHLFRPRGSRSSATPKKLVNVSLHVAVKGLDVLLHAFSRLAARDTELTLELIGEGPLTPDLRQLAKGLGLDERVRFPGLASPPEIADALRASDAYVLSSLSENMPLAVLEALCCGLPVAATDVGGVPEAVGRDGALAPPGDVDGLATAMRAVLDEYERFDRADIARRAATRYSFEAVGGVWDEVYGSLAAARRHSTSRL